MRICFVGPVFPYRGGIAHYTARLSRALQLQGADVTVISFKSLYLRRYFPGTTMVDESDEPYKYPATRILRPLAPWTWLRAIFRIRSMRSDLVILNWWHVFFAPCMLGMMYGVRLFTRARVAVICHNVDDHEPHAFLTRMANWMLAHSGAAVVFHSEKEADRLRRRYRLSRVVVHTHPPWDIFTAGPVSTRLEARQQLKLPLDTPLILFFGLVRTYKGLDDLLRAVALLNIPITPQLLAVGEFYDDYSRYETLVKQLGVEDRVRLINRYIPNEEVALYFTAADVLIAPYKTASQSGIVNIARAFRLPVIVSDAGGLPELVVPDKTGLVFPAQRPEALAGSITRFFEEDLGSQFRQNLKSEGSQETWDTLAEAVYQVARDSA